MTCEWCGKEIRLVAGDTGPELADADAFLAEHGACLAKRRVPRQRPPV